jgi:hypothetical protein
MVGKQIPVDSENTQLRTDKTYNVSVRVIYRDENSRSAFDLVPQSVNKGQGSKVPKSHFTLPATSHNDFTIGQDIDALDWPPIVPTKSRLDTRARCSRCIANTNSYALST